MLLITACGSEAATGSEQAKAEQTVAPGPITLTGGNVSLTVDPDYGARITSLKYGGREILQTDRDSAGLTFGSTAWTSPQADWDWPPPPALDSEPYRVDKLRDNVYLFTSGQDEETGLRLDKRVQVTDAGEIGLRYQITNQSGVPVGVAAWEVTRLPYAGRIEFYVGDTVWSDAYPMPVLFKEDKGITTFNEEHKEPKKLYATLRDTAVRYSVDDLVFTKQTMITGGNQVAKGHAPLEIYLDPKRGFVEFELQGGYYRLDPGQVADMHVKWTVRRQ